MHDLNHTMEAIEPLDHKYTINLTPTLDKRLRRTANKLDVPKSKIVRTALREFLNNTDEA